MLKVSFALLTLAPRCLLQLRSVSKGMEVHNARVLVLLPSTPLRKQGLLLIIFVGIGNSF